MVANMIFFTIYFVQSGSYVCIFIKVKTISHCSRAYHVWDGFTRWRTTRVVSVQMVLTLRT